MGAPTLALSKFRQVDQRMAEIAMSAFAGCGHVVAHALGSNGPEVTVSNRGKTLDRLAEFSVAAPSIKPKSAFL